MESLKMWLCVIVGTAVLAAAGWAAMKGYGIWAMRRDEAERAALQEEWKRRAAERKAKTAGEAGETSEEVEEKDEPNPRMD